MKGLLGYTVIVVISGAVCGTLDRYGFVTDASFYWFVGAITGIAANSIIMKG